MVLRWVSYRCLHLALATVAALLLFAGPLAEQAQAQAPEWDGIVPPDIQPGETYRILFVTSDTRNAVPSDIETYNTFVQDQADGATGAPFADVTFKVLGSTSAVDARCNTQTHRQDAHCPGVARVDDVPIYYYKGAKVADHYGDFYNGGWDSQESRDENGEPIDVAATRVFTRSNSDGTADDNALGDSSVSNGIPSLSGSEIHSPVSGSSDLESYFYALSGVLTAPAATLVDYDQNDDGLIEVSNLAQLNAMRWDLDGDGAASTGRQTGYDAAFPNAATGMGQRLRRCERTGWAQRHRQLRCGRHQRRHPCRRAGRAKRRHGPRQLRHGQRQRDHASRRAGREQLLQRQ